MLFMVRLLEDDLSKCIADCKGLIEVKISFHSHIFKEEFVMKHLLMVCFAFVIGVGSVTEVYAWKTEIIVVGDDISPLGEYNSIAFDQSNKAHISYYDASNGDLKYATNVSGLWTATTLDSNETVGRGTSIALDSSDNVHICYYSY